MAMFTEANLPINDQPINGNGKISCQVAAGSVFITIRRNGIATINNQEYSSTQGFSSSLDTTVDNGIWRIDVTGSALSAFTLTTPN